MWTARIIGASSNSGSGDFFIKNTTILRRKAEKNAQQPEHDLDHVCAATLTMSKRQCELVLDGGKLSVVDLGSRNGTYLVGPNDSEGENASGVNLKI